MNCINFQTATNMGFFKKIGKVAKRRLKFKNLIKYANPLNTLNPKFHIKEMKDNFRDIKTLTKGH